MNTGAYSESPTALRASCFVLIQARAHDHAVADRPGPSVSSLYPDSIASDEMFRRRHDHVLTFLDELVRLDPYGLPALEKVDEHPLCLFSTIDPWHWADRPRQIKLEVRRYVSKGGLPVASHGSIQRGADDLHVLVRNRRSPRRLGQWFQRNALPETL